MQRFDLTLREIKTVNSRRCAVFQILLEATDHKMGQMRMQLEGPMAVEIASCRSVAAELTGPIGVAKAVVGPGTTYHMTGAGRLKVTIDSSYEDLQPVSCQAR